MLDFLVKTISTTVYLSIPLYILKVLSNRSPTTRYYYGLFVYLASLSVCCAWGVAVSIVLTILGRRYDINYYVARSFYFVGGTALGIQFEIEGEHHFDNGPAVLVGNHQTMLDILFLGRCGPVYGALGRHH